jgi:hypothetical protein
MMETGDERFKKIQGNSRKIRADSYEILRDPWKI